MTAARYLAFVATRAHALAAILLVLAIGASACGGATGSHPVGPSSRAATVTRPLSTTARSIPSSELSRRDEAVMRGLDWMASYLASPGHIDEVGVDAVQLFAEVATTAANNQLRARARIHGREVATRVSPHYRTVALDAETLLELLDLLTWLKALNVESPALLARAREAYGTYDDFWAIAETSDVNMRKDEDSIYAALIDSYIIERVHFTAPKLFTMRSELPRLLRFLAKRDYTSGLLDDDWDVFQDHAYLLTHVIYVLSDYGRIPFEPKQVPWVMRFLRDNFDYALVEEDVELIGEFIDIFRATGRTEANDAMVRQGTAFLLASQHDDGSWGEVEKSDDAYDIIHYTWCAVSGLTERRLVSQSPYGSRIAEVMQAALTASTPGSPTPP